MRLPALSAGPPVRRAGVELTSSAVVPLPPHATVPGSANCLIKVSRTPSVLRRVVKRTGVAARGRAGFVSLGDGCGGGSQARAHRTKSGVRQFGKQVLKLGSSEAFFPTKVFFLKRGGGKLLRLRMRGLHSLGVVSAAQRGLSCLKGWGRSCRRVPNAVLHLKFQANLTVIHRALTLYRCALQ